MLPPTIAHQRLANQRLSGQSFVTPEDVVSWMGAVQSQDYAGAKWSLALRMAQGGDDALDVAFNEGRILRTHVMRPTWHFVTPADIRWLLELTGARVDALCGTYYRQVGLDASTLAASNAVIVKQLEGGHALTRAELGVALEAAGINTSELRLGFLMGHAELNALICSGPRRGKQFTYALLDERAPQAKSLPLEEALATLVLRYFTSHGPATLADFAWWSGLTLADAKAGVASAGNSLGNEEIEGQTYWFSDATPPDSTPDLSAFLLPTFDEYWVGFSAFDQMRRGSGNLVFESTIVMDGQAAGSWKRTLRKASVTIELAPFAPLSADQHATLAAAANRYGDFVGKPVESVYLK